MHTFISVLSLVWSLFWFSFFVVVMTDKHALKHGKEITAIRWYLSRPAAHLADFVLFRLFIPTQYWRLVRIFVFMRKISCWIKYVPQPEEDGFVDIHYEEL